MDLLKCIQNLGSWRDERKESADPLVRSYSRCIIIALAVPFLTAFYSQYAHIRAVADSPLQRCMNRVNLNLTASYSRQQSLFKWKCSMLDRPWNFFFRDILCFMFYAILLNYVVVLILNKSRNDDLFFFFFFLKNYYIYIYIFVRVDTYKFIMLQAENWDSKETTHSWQKAILLGLSDSGSNDKICWTQYLVYYLVGLRRSC